jgi:hypothetical protein
VDAQTAARQYPVRLSIDYPDRELNRATTFFRIIVAIPIFIVLGAISGWGWGGGWGEGRGYVDAASAAGGLLFLAPLLMILFRQKYPRWCAGGSIGTSTCSDSRIEHSPIWL